MNSEQTLAQKAAEGFRARFGHAPQRIAFAPGRVNLIGEHTDYNDGFALPAALSCGTAVALAARDDGHMVVHAIDLDAEDASFAITAPIAPAPSGDWQNHPRGIAAGMQAIASQPLLPLGGATIAIAGDVPQGSGLSSSASLGVALGLGLAALAGEDAPDRRSLARLAQWAEHHFVGCACGLMDQLASAFGQAGKALLLDCRSNSTQAIDFPDNAAMVIAHSGITRGLVDSAYNQRRAQCFAAAAHYGVAALRDLDLPALLAGKAGLDAVAYRRAHHVVSENARVLRAAKAMKAGDLAALGEAMRASHASMRDDFEITLPAIDAMVAVANAAIGSAGGARMTGGGFGGCIVAICPKDRVAALCAALEGQWQRQGLPPQLLLVTQPADGARMIS